MEGGQNNINFILQGKGGVGKTLISSILAQYKMETDDSRLICIDTDPVNATFANFKAIGARRLEIMDDTKINEAKFDQMMEMILSEESDFIIDNGASSFVPLSSYLVENKAIEMLAESGKKVIVHVVVTGGNAFSDTLTGLRKVANQFGDSIEIIVWLNEFFGPVEANGKSFEEMKVYNENKSLITGIIRMPKKSADTFGKDTERMLERKLTFNEAVESKEFTIMAKQRLKMIKDSFFQQLSLCI